MNEIKAAYHRRYNAARYARLKESGLCTACGKVPPIPGKTQCEVCAAKNRQNSEFTRRARRLSGLCLYCGREKVEQGHSICPACLAKQNALMKARRIQKNAERSAVNG